MYLLRKKLLLLCLFAGVVYLVCILLSVFSYPSVSLEYISSTTTTTPTPLILLMKPKHNLKTKNITIEKYDALKVHSDIMKRKITMMTEKMSSRNTNYPPKKNLIDDRVHLFYSEFLKKVDKKSVKFWNLRSLSNRTLTDDLVERNLKIAQAAGAGVLFVICPRLSVSLMSQNSRIHQILRGLFQLAPKYGVKISIAVKEYLKRNVMSIRRDMRIFISTYGTQPALYKIQRPEDSGPRPVIYIFNSFAIPSSEWLEVLSPAGRFTIRNTGTDSIILGQLQDEEHTSHIRQSKFDGFFTCCLMNGDSFASTWKNWQSLSVWAEGRGLLWSAGIVEGTGGFPAIGTALRTTIRIQPHPSFVSFSNIPLIDDYAMLTQNWLRKWTKSNETDSDLI